MEAVVIFIVLAVIGAIAAAFRGSAQPDIYARARDLQSKFQNLGVLTGKTRAEIEAVVGPPNSISSVAGGKILCQWIETGFHVALLFKDDVFEGVTHEYIG